MRNLVGGSGKRNQVCSLRPDKMGRPENYSDHAKTAKRIFTGSFRGLGGVQEKMARMQDNNDLKNGGNRACNGIECFVTGLEAVVALLGSAVLRVAKVGMQEA